MPFARSFPPLIAGIAAHWHVSPLSASTIRHTELSDFAGGLSDGIPVPMGGVTTPADGPPTGGVGILPGLDASLIDNDLGYPDMAADQSAGLRFQLLNEQPAAPSSLSLTISATRIKASRPQDRLEPNSKRSPVLLVNNRPITEGFVAETKLKISAGRVDLADAAQILRPPEN